MKLSVSNYLSQKIRFTAGKAQTGEEIWHVTLSRVSAVLCTLGAVGAVIAISVLMTLRSPLANYMPGFHGKRAQKQLADAMNKLDSLDGQISRWETYNGNLLLVLEGGNTAVSEAADSIRKGEHKTAPRIVMDSLLREKVRQDSALIKSGTGKRGMLETFPPSSGMITSRFDPEIGQNGISIAPPPGGNILSIMDGTVICSSWEPSTGWTITIQHSGGMISIYRNVASLLTDIGERVRPGQVIGLAQTLEGGKAPKLVLELWYNGHLADPENYINF